MIGGVGQRVLTGVAKKTTGELFKSVDQVLGGGLPAEAAAEPAAAAAADTPAPGVFVRPPAKARPGGMFSGDFAKGALFGAAVALLGALVGDVIGRL